MVRQNISLSYFFLSQTSARRLSVWISRVCFPGVVQRQRVFFVLFSGRGIVVFPFFPTITMLDHCYTNGGALAFQGASIKEGKKSCSRRGEIHFVPGSNICCSRPSQKDARIKPKSPLIYCNDRQTDRQAERMTICGSEGEKGKDKNNFCLTVCHFLVLSMCMCQWW